MTRLLTLALMASAVTLAACSSMDNGKTYPAPYAQDRTAGAVGATHSAEPVFEKRMSK